MTICEPMHLIRCTGPGISGRNPKDMKRTNAVVGLVLCAACATTPTPPSGDGISLTAGSTSEGVRICSISDPIPQSPGAILDVEGYRAALGHVVHEAIDGDVVFSAGADSTGTLTAVHVLRTSLTDSLAALLGEALRGHVQALTRGSHATGWHYRLQVTPAGGDDFVRVDPSVYCRARVEDRTAVAHRIRYSVARRPDIQMLRMYERRPTLLLRIGRNGRVREVRILKSSGYHGVDRIAMDAVSGAKFMPALIDGEPVEDWITWSIYVG